MSETEYGEWWKLHRRAAVGETLSDAERDTYEDGLARLHAEKTLVTSPERVKAMEERIAELEAKRETMEAQRHELRTFLTKKAKEQNVAERHSIVDVLAEAPGHLAFQTADEVDAYLREEREAWEH